MLLLVNSFAALEKQSRWSVHIMRLAVVNSLLANLLVNLDVLLSRLHATGHTGCWTCGRCAYDGEVQPRVCDEGYTAMLANHIQDTLNIPTYPGCDEWLLFKYNRLE